MAGLRSYMTEALPSEAQIKSNLIDSYQEHSNLIIM